MNGKKGMVVYIKLDEYNDIKDLVNLIGEKIKDAKFLLNKVAELKKREDEEIEGLSSELAKAEERTQEIGTILNHPGM